MSQSRPSLFQVEPVTYSAPATSNYTLHGAHTPSVPPPHIKVLGHLGLLRLCIYVPMYMGVDTRGTLCVFLSFSLLYYYFFKDLFLLCE